MMELFERLSYYGINQGLKNFMQKIGWRLVSASALKSTWTSIDYITPLFGVYLADGKWGCFRTILTFGICHCIGDFLVAIAAHPNIMTKEAVVNLSGAVVVTGPFLLLFSLVVNVASSFSADNGRAVVRCCCDGAGQCGLLGVRRQPGLPIMVLLFVTSAYTA
ncbi:hypothetical protein PRNP1_002743 [Phytophthora ramorum]